MVRNRNTVFPFWMKFSFALVIFALLVGGIWFFKVQQKQNHRKFEEQLMTIAQLKVNQIEEWRRDQMVDAALIAKLSFIVQEMNQLSSNPLENPSDQIRAFLQSIRAQHDYSDILWADSKGRLRLSLDGHQQVPDLYREALSNVLIGFQPVFLDLQRATKTDTPNTCVIQPVLLTENREQKVTGALIFVNTASQFLYPLIQSWPTRSRTSEILLVRRDGDNVIFLNELRHQNDTALKLRIPLSQTDLPAAMAVNGKTGIVNEKDYRGVDVVAAIQSIADSPCFVICKIDMNETLCRILGYSQEEIIGHDFREFLDEESKIFVADRYVKRQSGEAVPSRYEFNVVRKYDKKRRVEIGSTVIKDLYGKTKTIGQILDITERKLAQDQIKKDLKEKEVLLRELYHRTKNNMQVISSMLHLKAHTISDNQTRFLFSEIENKIQAMALVHHKLYESHDLSSLNLKTYFYDLISLIRSSYFTGKDRIKIVLEAKDAPALIDTAIPLGLILNELLTNAVKHAFPNERQGEIHVRLDAGPRKGIIIEVSDNGVGLPEDFDMEKDSHLGLQTVLDLAKHQLGGEITFKSKNGCTCRIVIHKELYKPRV